MQALHQLRVATSAVHQSLDGNSILSPILLDTVQAKMVLTGLRGLLRAHQHIHQALEHADARYQEAWRIKDGRADLMQDVAYWAQATGTLGMAGLADPAMSLPQAIPLSAGAWMGMAYVMEGSALGGLKLARHVQARLGLGSEQGLRFWLSAEADPSRWPRFMRCLQSSVDPESHSMSEAIEAGLWCFSVFEQALRPQ